MSESVVMGGSAEATSRERCRSMLVSAVMCERACGTSITESSHGMQPVTGRGCDGGVWSQVMQWIDMEECHTFSPVL